MSDAKSLLAPWAIAKEKDATSFCGRSGTVGIECKTRSPAFFVAGERCEPSGAEMADVATPSPEFYRAKSLADLPRMLMGGTVQCAGPANVTLHRRIDISDSARGSTGT